MIPDQFNKVLGRPYRPFFSRAMILSKVLFFDKDSELFALHLKFWFVCFPQSYSRFFEIFFEL